MTDELKPCPFCGSNAEMRQSGYGWFVTCTGTDCGSAMDNAPMDPGGAAIAWNRRTDLSAQSSQQGWVSPEMQDRFFNIAETVMERFELADGSHQHLARHTAVVAAMESAFLTQSPDSYQMRESLKGATVIAAAAGAEIRSLRKQNEALRQELKNIANADTVAWDDPTEFEAWAKSRARHALSQQPAQDKKP